MTRRSHADIGGETGHGPVTPERDEPWFHAPWERRAFAVTLAMGGTGAWTLDQSRAARETLPDYARRSYYQVWIAGVETLAAERGLLSAEEIAAGRPIDPPKRVPRKLTSDRVHAVLAAGAPTERPAPAAPRYDIGDVVRTRRIDAARGHTRLPRYAQGARGVIVARHGAHVFPDANGMGAGEAAEWLYTVRFAARDLFPDADARDEARIDAFESYLEAP